MEIKNIKAREILDSRGNPTVEVDVILEDGIIGRSSVPSGASTGSREALELRDNEDRYLKKGVLKAINNIEKIKNHFIGLDVFDQKKIDDLLIKLDGTFNKSKLGANAILGVSLACLKASANENKVSLYRYIGTVHSLPRIMVNILNGGVHADNKLDFQEFMIIPNASSIKKKIQIASEIFHTLKNVLKERGLSTNVGDEGGFAPELSSNKEALEIIIEAIKKANYIPGKDVNLALDIAASQFYREGFYYLENIKLSTSELVAYYELLVNEFPIISIEDPFDENDWEGFSILTEKIGDKIQIVGDDLFVTNKKYLQKGIENKAANAILIKMNQIGTITETFETIRLAKENGYSCIISHRSGETEDTSIAHLAVGLDIGQIKTGSMSRTDRICKYNELIRIEEELEKNKF